MQIKIISFLIMMFFSTVCWATTNIDFHLDSDLKVKGRVYVSKILSTDPMDRAVLSWNTKTPKESYIELQLRAKSKNWSNWFTMGVWGENIDSYSVSDQNTKFGSVDIDTLKLNTAATEWQYKIILHEDKTTKQSPQIFSIGLATKNSKNYNKSIGEIQPIQPLNVPTFSQFESAKNGGYEKWARLICSPTSVAMLLDYNNNHLSPLEVANKVKDNNGKETFGNWSFNVATLFSGLKQTNLKVYARWYEKLSDALENLKSGQPIIVSVGFKKGELHGSPLPALAGHLIVIKGVDDKYIYINDPAASSHKTVSRKYLLSEFVRAWKGIAYVVEN